jgi:light-regulated signal transduction histidine kinase (bacteriophytochrome)
MEAARKKSEVTPIEAGQAELAIPLSYDSLHDLVSPANQVCTLTSLLLKEYGNRLGPEADALVGLIQGSMGRLQNLVGGFRLYAQIVGRAAPYEACDATSLLAGALGSLQTALHGSGATVTQDRLPELPCDPAQISYLFASLLDNAIKFRSQQPPKIHISAVGNDDQWTFAIRDNGIGIEAKYHRRIFDLFKRVHNDAYPGAGVGLAIAERVVQRHGGRIWVESDLGSGATFFFSLPKSALPQREVTVA